MSEVQPAHIHVKVGEVRSVKFTITDSDGDPVPDLDTATYSFRAVDEDDVEAFTIADGVFDKSDAATGIILMPLSAANLANAGTLTGDLKIEFLAGDIEKTRDVVIHVERAIVS